MNSKIILPAATSLLFDGRQFSYAMQNRYPSESNTHDPSVVETPQSHAFFSLDEADL